MTEKPMFKEYCLELSGDFACFTRPELKVERVSYDVITPSAARNIFQAILWKPAIRWEVSRIEVRKPIRHISVKRNEVGALARPGGKEILIEEARQQRTSYILRDVEYRIFALGRLPLLAVSLQRSQRRTKSDRLEITGKLVLVCMAGPEDIGDAGKEVIGVLAFTKQIVECTGVSLSGLW